MRIHRIVFAAALIFVVAAPAIPAEEPSWTLRLHGAIVESSAGSETDLGNGVGSSVEVGGGLGIAAEYRLSDRLGVEFSVLFAGLEIESRLAGGASVGQSLELSMVPLTVAVPFHFDTAGRPDFFVAPTFSFVRYVDIDTKLTGTAVGARVDVGSDTAIGAAVGVDLPFGTGKWAFSAGLRYMKTDAEGAEIDPAILTLGFARRF